MAGLSGEVINGLRYFLIEFPELSDIKDLRAFMKANEALKPWWGSVPVGDSPSVQVDLLVSFLMDKKHTKHGNALVSFVVALVEKYKCNPPSNRAADMIQAVLTWKVESNGSPLTLLQ